MRNEKYVMAEVAMLYYEKKHTQQEIAEMLGITRQTVSRLLGDAVKENIVEIIIHNPHKTCETLEKKLVKTFGLENAVVCAAASKNNVIRKQLTVKAARDYIVPLIEKGNQKIGVSWGRTVKELVNALGDRQTTGNLVFPLFGATDTKNYAFSSNEIARDLGEKIDAEVQYAWFPYLTDTKEDRMLMEKTSYYKKIQKLWDTIDIAICGIGNAEILESFEEAFGPRENSAKIIGDIATHFFDENGMLSALYENTICASFENLRNAGQTIGVACGSDKVCAIRGALKTKLLNVLITDEYTARQVLEEETR